MLRRHTLKFSILLASALVVGGAGSGAYGFGDLSAAAFVPSINELISEVTPASEKKNHLAAAVDTAVESKGKGCGVAGCLTCKENGLAHTHNSGIVSTNPVIKVVPGNASSFIDEVLQLPEDKIAPRVKRDKPATMQLNQAKALVNVQPEPLFFAAISGIGSASKTKVAPANPPKVATVPLSQTAKSTVQPDPKTTLKNSAAAVKSNAATPKKVVSGQSVPQTTGGTVIIDGRPARVVQGGFIQDNRFISNGNPVGNNVVGGNVVSQPIIQSQPITSPVYYGQPQFQPYNIQSGSS